MGGGRTLTSYGYKYIVLLNRSLHQIVIDVLTQIQIVMGSENKDPWLYEW